MVYLHSNANPKRTMHAIHAYNPSIRGWGRSHCPASLMEMEASSAVRDSAEGNKVPNILLCPPHVCPWAGDPTLMHTHTMHMCMTYIYMHPKKFHKKVNSRLKRYCTERRESSLSIGLIGNYYSECIMNLKIKCQMNIATNRGVNEFLKEV